MLRIERILFLIGFALLAVWGAGTLQSIALSRASLAAFQANEVTNTGGRRQAPHSLDREEIDAPLAVLSIPRIDLEVPLFNGDDDATLNRGVGRVPGTAQLGAGSNLGIAGHRDRFFRGLKDVEQGDLIELSSSGRIDFYVIDWTRIVDPTDVSVLGPTPMPSLTLITCYPFYFVGSAPQRYIVRASLRSSIPSRASATMDSTSAGN